MVCLGFEPGCHRMVGADEATELCVAALEAKLFKCKVYFVPIFKNDLAY